MLQCCDYIFPLLLHPGEFPGGSKRKGVAQWSTSAGVAQPGLHPDPKGKPTLGAITAQILQNFP